MHSESWLNEMLWCGFSDHMKRRAVIWRFTKYGLFPFLKANGYPLRIDEKEMSTGIASLLFHNWTHTVLTPLYVHRVDDYSIEHKQHYNHVIDPAAWSNFWKRWDWWEDISLDSGRGFYRRLDIQEYCWSQLELSASPHTRIVEEFIEGDEQQYVFREEQDEY